MAATAESLESPSYRFEGRDFAWEPFLGEEGVQFAIVDIDTEHRSVDLIVKFAPGAMAPNHRHLAAFTALVLEGEHHIHEVDKDGKALVKVRKAGTFTRSAAGGVHREGGGPEGGTVWFNLRPEVDGLYEILDAEGALVDSFGIKSLLDAASA